MADEGPRLQLMDGLEGAISMALRDIIRDAVKRHVDAILEDHVLLPREPDERMTAFVAHWLDSTDGYAKKFLEALAKWQLSAYESNQGS